MEEALQPGYCLARDSVHLADGVHGPFADRRGLAFRSRWTAGLDARRPRQKTDVCGHTRAIIGALAGHGVKFLDIGANGACTVPEVPPSSAERSCRPRTDDGLSCGLRRHRQDPGSDLAVDVAMHAITTVPIPSKKFARSLPGCGSDSPMLA